MKLTRLTLKNFRCFDELDIHFDDKLTVLIAPNGAGKTTVLDAARVALGAFRKGFDVGSANPEEIPVITQADVHLKKMPSGNMEPQKPSEIKVEGVFSATGQQVPGWKLWRESVEPNTWMFSDGQSNTVTGTAKELEKRLEDIQTTERTELPVILYLGTGRLWYQGRFIAKVDDKKLEQRMYSRTWAYKGCLTSTSGYKQFEDWYGWLFKSYRELQIATLENPSTHNEQELNRFKQSVEAVQRAINEVTESVTGWKNLQYRQSQGQKLVMEHDELGFMPLDMLSDGLRNIVTLVADIAFRCVRLNPQFGGQAALQTRGVVLIDEVDMFLHPSWQQQVIGSLQRAFPKLQLIVTTHSPQVLTTVPNQCIRVLETIKKNDQTLFVARQPDKQSRGVASNDLLAELQHTNPTPDVPEAKWLSAYKALIQQNVHATPKGYELKQKILDHFGDQHREWRECERLIRLQAIKAKLPPSNH